MFKEEDFKNVMSRLASGVSIISTSWNGALFGFTASSFLSLSLNPPMVLFCLRKESYSNKAFNNAKYFAVSILCEEQEYLARHFAQTNPALNKDGHHEKFTSTLPYEIASYSKCPLIKGAMCFIECDYESAHSAGDHDIIIGNVRVVKVNNQYKPLLYYSRGYHKLN